jgi:glycosyltransferase involved in cell wall biosynthesis
MHRKILIITDNTRDQINGVVTTFRNIERYSWSDGYYFEYIDPTFFPKRSAPGYSEVKLSWPRGIGKIIDQSNPDYVHIATEGPVGLFARMWLDRQGWRYNTSYHTKFPEFIKSIYGVPEWITYAYVRWFHKHSGRVLTTTDTMVKDLQRHGFRGEILSWTRGVDRGDLSPSRQRNIRLLTAKPTILNVGRVSKEKGLDDLCRLQDRYHIQIVGDGPYRQELERRYPRVQFFGYKQGAELADIYQDADVFCFPSRSDTFGLVMIESMSLGTPVAAYPVAGPVDVIEPGITGYMAQDLEQAIERCLKYDRQRVRLASSRWTWKHCWEIFRDNLVDIV